MNPQDHMNLNQIHSTYPLSDGSVLHHNNRVSMCDILHSVRDEDARLVAKNTTNGLVEDARANMRIHSTETYKPFEKCSTLEREYK